MIEARNLTKRYGKLLALDDLSLDIGPGEVFGFIGPNGAGKSTTMKILACLMKADSGKATVDGHDVRTEGATIRRLIGYMPDFLGVYEDLTVDEYLQFFASAFEIPRKQRKTVVEGVLELTDLADKRRSPVDGLSRGMTQRLGVARVLIHDPKVLLLDEPASGLDPRARIEMRTLLAELGRMGKSIMISSHILTELAELCNSIGIIEKGKLLFSGSLEDAYKKASLGDRVRISIEGGVSTEIAAAALESDGRVMRVSTNGSSITVDLGPEVDSRHFLVEKLVAAGARIGAIRPEEARLEDAFLRLTKGNVQ